MTSLNRIAEQDQFYVEQSFSPLVNKYRVSELAADDSAGRQLAFVQQKRLAIREQVDIYADESQNEHLLRLKAKRVFEARGRSEVQLPDGTVIGQLQKVFSKSLLRSSWELLDSHGNQVATAQESSLPIALFRRFYSFVPVIGSIPIPIPFNFDIAIDGRTVGTYRRIWGIRDKYVMDLTGDPQRRLDRRVAMAFAIALDALQDR